MVYARFRRLLAGVISFMGIRLVDAGPASATVGGFPRQLNSAVLPARPGA
jgi:hypothetical protein